MLIPSDAAGDVGRSSARGAAIATPSRRFRCDLIADGDYLRVRFGSSGEDIFAETLAIYRHVLDLARSAAHPHLVKCHNFIPGILRDERYQAFNRARRQAFEEHRCERHPASSAVGSPQRRGLEINCLLGREPPVEIENPRQVSAYAYPERYGPRPLFARAVLDQGHLYISGTASIVGSESLHPGDLIGQYDETMRNIRAITGPLGMGLGDLTFVIYVKHEADLPVIRAHFSGAAQFVVTDICRPELLIEIEATSTHGRHLAPLYA